MLVTTAFINPYSEFERCFEAIGQEVNEMEAYMKELWKGRQQQQKKQQQVDECYREMEKTGYVLQIILLSS